MLLMRFLNIQMINSFSYIGQAWVGQPGRWLVSADLGWLVQEMAGIGRPWMVEEHMLGVGCGLAW